MPISIKAFITSVTVALAASHPSQALTVAEAGFGHQGRVAVDADPAPGFVGEIKFDEASPSQARATAGIRSGFIDPDTQREFAALQSASVSGNLRSGQISGASGTLSNPFARGIARIIQVETIHLDLGAFAPSSFVTFTVTSTGTGIAEVSRFGISEILRTFSASADGSLGWSEGGSLITSRSGDEDSVSGTVTPGFVEAGFERIDLQMSLRGGESYEIALAHEFTSIGQTRFGGRLSVSSSEDVSFTSASGVFLADTDIAPIPLPATAPFLLGGLLFLSTVKRLRRS